MISFLCIVIGYLLGSLNPAALLSRLKKKDLRKHGTGNLGATNTMLVFGKRYGALVMVFDIAKTWLAVKLAEFLFPNLIAAGLIAGCGAVIGHIFPFYLKFKGGKGFAAYAGMILAFDPISFLILLVICTTLMILANYSAAMPMSAAVLFPILTLIRTGSPVLVLIAVGIGIVIVIKHWRNLRKGINGSDIQI